MAEIQPLRALHYDPARTGGFQDVVAPPYDVIDAEQRAELVARSPYNVVRDRPPAGRRSIRERRGSELDAVARRRRRRAGRAARALAAGAGLHRPGRAPAHPHRLPRARARNRVRPRHDPPARAHAPRARGRIASDSRARRRRTCRRSSRSTRTRTARSSGALEPTTSAPSPTQLTTDDDGTVNRLWRLVDPSAIDAVTRALEPRELLIADGHHRYETARVYAEEIGGEGPHRYVLMCLVALAGPGPDGVPDPPARATGSDPTSTRRSRPRSSATSTIEPLTDRRQLAPPGERRVEDRLHRRPLPQAVHAHAEGRRRSPTRRCPTTPSRTGGSTPPCSRR